MIESMIRAWWVLALRGVVAILFGILAFARPDISLAALVALFGAYALVDGIVYTIAAPMASGTSIFWWLLLDGILGIAVGVLTFLYPVAVAESLLFLLGAWLIATGLFRVGLAIELRKEIPDEWLLILSGVLSVLCGGLIFYKPGPSLLAWIWVIGVYAIAYGIVMLTAGFRLKGLSGDLPHARLATHS